MNKDVIERAIQFANCGMMGLYGGSLVSTGVASLSAGGVGLVPLTKGSLILLGAAALCSEGELGDNPNAQWPAKGQQPGDCWELESCGALNIRRSDGLVTGGGPAIRISGIEENELGYVRCNYLDCDGINQSTSFFNQSDYAYTFFLDGAPCKNNGIPNDKLPDGADQPITYIDNETNCTYKMSLQGFAESFEGGPQNPVWIMEGANNDSTRSSGSRFGGCNFAPVVVYDDGSGSGGRPPYPPIPVPEGDKDWNWQDLLKKAIPVVIGNLVSSSIQSFFAAQLPTASFTLVAPCNKDEKGVPLRVDYKLPIQNYQSRVLSQQAVIMEILQQHLNWKTPICSGKNEKGIYVRSLAFESTPDPDNNYQRTIKRFRYRSNSPCDVRQLAAHWRDFVWNTGPVIVQHLGSALGSPQVWASSVAEGKRVIQHAGREAGVDPDKAGEWSIGGPNSSRYGVRATVRLKEVDGIWAATARIGPSDWPPSSTVT